MIQYFVICLLLGLSACMPATQQGVFIEKLIATTDPDANMKSPVAVDVVVSYDPKLTQQLANMTARQYFKSKKQLQHDYFGRFYSEGWELPPNFSVTETIYHHPLGVSAIFLFADYFTPGDHRLRLIPGEIVHVHLMRTGMTLTSATHEEGYHESQYRKPDMTIIDNRRARRDEKRE